MKINFELPTIEFIRDNLEAEYFMTEPEHAESHFEKIAMVDGQLVARGYTIYGYHYEDSITDEYIYMTIGWTLTADNEFTFDEEAFDCGGHDTIDDALNDLKDYLNCELKQLVA